MKKQFVAAALAVCGIQAMAGPSYLGSWTVDQGPFWGTGPQEYSGQQAAALLFFGMTGDANPLDYAVSTNGDSTGTINDAAWYSVYGSNSSYGGPAPLGSFNGGFADEGLILPDNYTNDVNYSASGDVSSYVRDWALGTTFTNFAFYDPVGTVPEPTSLLLIGTSLLAMVGVVKRQSRR
ncbi:MAG: PEP-CTERM sorting domain-containing protein [Burkholderiaceae bacterium]|nr:PEP-CTERM sorting domain-containing protein [Roseateles sp.]MBV8471257.1 PEP-CTERM sorting domain-containing protein [Burkholderiaceae bacterium]